MPTITRKRKITLLLRGHPALLHIAEDRKDFQACDMSGKIGLVGEQTSELVNRNRLGDKLTLKSKTTITIKVVPESGSDRKDDASHFRRQTVVDVIIIDLDAG